MNVIELIEAQAREVENTRLELTHAAQTCATLQARLAEETAIVDRIWDIYGRPTYEQLAGRSIYDLINADRKRLAELEAEHAAFSNNVEQCEAENDRLRQRLRDWHRVADERSAEIVRLSARLAEAERDAARYRWLRDRWLLAGDVQFPDVPDHDSLSASHVDDAFDAAMAADSATHLETANNS